MKHKASKVRLTCLYNSESPVAEFYRILRTNIEYSQVLTPVKSLLVTSTLPGEGKTTIISNLALIMSQTGKRVVLVDGDLRQPSVHRVFRTFEGGGLIGILTERLKPEQAIQSVPGTALDILPAGSVPANPSEFLGSNAMAELLHWLHARYDFVLIDSPPVLPVTDSQVLAKCVDGVLLVIESGKTPSDEILRAKALLDLVRANIIGTVLNCKK